MAAARAPEYLHGGSRTVAKGFCVVLLTCLALPPGSPGKWVSPLSAILQHVFSVPNTPGVSLVHHADKFRTNTLSPGCRFETLTLRSYCHLPSFADLKVFFTANEYASFIATFHMSAYSVWVTLVSPKEGPNIRSTGRRGDLPNSR